jgi:hypothetical protein
MQELVLLFVRTFFLLCSKFLSKYSTVFWKSTFSQSISMGYRSDAKSGHSTTCIIFIYSRILLVSQAQNGTK